ncbi:MAG: B12-binding domain-containing protein [Methanomassiliicoccales archaeon]
MMDEETCNTVYECITKGDVKRAVTLGQELHESGASSVEVGKVLIEAMEAVGHQYREREIALPQLILATHSFKKLLLPYVNEAHGESGNVVMGVVKNDIHDIGKNLVVGMLQVYGFEVEDLGRDVPLDNFVDKAKETGADMVFAGTLLTATMTEMETIMNKMEEAGIRQSTKFAVGGAPITTTYAKRIGADGYASDAILAVQVAKKFMSGESNAYLASREDRTA